MPFRVTTLTPWPEAGAEGVRERRPAKNRRVPLKRHNRRLEKTDLRRSMTIKHLTARRLVTALYDSHPDISHRERSALERPRSGKRLQVQMGLDPAGSAEETGDPEETAAPRPRGAARGRGRRSPRTHPRPGRGRPVLRLLAAGGCNGAGGDASCGSAHGRAGWTRIRLGSALLGPAGPVGERQQPRQKREPDAELAQPSRTTPELDTAEVKTLRLRPSGRAAGASGRRLAERLRRFHPKPGSQELGGSRRRGSSIYGKTSKRRASGKGGPEEKLSAYGAPRGPRRVAIHVHSPDKASRRTLYIDEVSGDPEPYA